jgi:hypothetical protein
VLVTRKGPVLVAHFLNLFVDDHRIVDTMYGDRSWNCWGTPALRECRHYLSTTIIISITGTMMEWQDNG